MSSFLGTLELLYGSIAGHRLRLVEFDNDVAETRSMYHVFDCERVPGVFENN